MKARYDVAHSLFETLFIYMTSEMIYCRDERNGLFKWVGVI